MKVLKIIGRYLGLPFRAIAAVLLPVGFVMALAVDNSLALNCTPRQLLHWVWTAEGFGQS